jgi:hypothetical protein
MMMMVMWKSSVLHCLTLTNSIVASGGNVNVFNSWSYGLFLWIKNAWYLSILQIMPHFQISNIALTKRKVKILIWHPLFKFLDTRSNDSLVKWKGLYSLPPSSTDKSNGSIMKHFKYRSHNIVADVGYSLERNCETFIWKL